MISFDSSDIVNWADNPEAPHLFPELVRRLILASGPLPDFLDMPSGSSVRLPGWDGLLSVSEGNLWVPSGRSAWELSCEKVPKQKADADYEKRTNDTQGEIASETTFVHVTARKFGNKNAWADSRQQEGIWADVRVIDADDLIVWLSESPAISEWFARRIGQIPDAGVIPLQDWWENWASFTDPKTIPDLVLAGRKQEVESVGAWVTGVGSHCFIQGNTREEAIAFFAASSYYKEDEWGSTVLARTLVVQTDEAWRGLEHHNLPLVLIPNFVGGSAPQIAVKEGHHVLTPLDASQDPVGNGHILPRLGRDETSRALTDMGLSESKVVELVEKTARRLSVLRRFLVEEAGFPGPAWAASASSSLVALVLVGQWEEDSLGDREFIENLTGKPYADIEEELVAIAGSPDSPLVRAGRRWRFTSHDEAWNVLAQRLTETRVALFRELASSTLSQVSPQFELPVDERYLAPVLGKTLAQSSTIREGLARTLALMGTYPERAKNLDSVWYLPSQVITETLSEDKGWEIWATLSHDLATLAEASPDAVLDAAERCLSVGPSPLEELFGQGGSTLFAGTPYTGLLWALERLAWSADHFSRVAMILVRLAEFEPETNIVNKPTESLRGLFVPGLSFTELSDGERLETLRTVVDRYPRPGWKLLVDIYPTGRGLVLNRHLPHWRAWGQDASTRQTIEECEIYIGGIEECLVGGVQNDAERWTDMMSIVYNLSPRTQSQVFKALFDQTDILREQLAGKALWCKIRYELNRHRSFPEAKWAMTEEETSALFEAYERLIPLDPVLANSWLFCERPAFPNPAPAESTTWEEEQQRADEAQREAVREIYSHGGEPSIIRLAELASNPGTVGRAVSRALETDLAVSLAIPHVGSTNSELRDFAKRTMFTLSHDLGWEPLWKILSQLKAKEAKPSQIAEVFLSAEAGSETWQRLAAELPETQKEYWNSIQPFMIPRENPDDFNFGVQQIIDAERASDVVQLLAYVDGHVELTLKILAQLPIEHSRQTVEGRQSVIHGYSIGCLLGKLDQAQYVSDVVIAGLEIPFLLVLDYQQRELALHREVLRHPSLYADMISWVFKRSDGYEDTDEETRERRAEVGFQVLLNLHGIPGINEHGEVDKEILNEWVNEARRLCKERDREAIGDEQIGQLLANSPTGSDGLWPCEPVRDLLDSLASQQMGRGFTIGKFNLRGVTSRGVFEGGESERSLADGYQTSSTKIAPTWPFTAQLLRKMAEDYDLSGRQFDRESDWRDQFLV